MVRYALLLLLAGAHALNLDYLDPTKLQTKTSPQVQQQAALKIITRYINSNQVAVEVNPLLFNDNKDVFVLRTSNGVLNIRASSGVAAVWGFNYYLKKYCKSQIAWQVKRVLIPNPLPDADEMVVANDRFRFYQNVCTVSYSFVWYKIPDWEDHVEWMALNGLNLVLAPVAQEAAWAKVYRQFGMTDDEIDQHFTGPAFLSWLRMGNIHGWGGPLLKTWHDSQRNIQDKIVELMFQLGIVPVFPSFNGHVPTAFAKLFPDITFHSVDKWNKFDDDNCCGLFLDPIAPLFKNIGKAFLREVTAGSTTGNIYTADPFNEVQIKDFSTALAQDTAEAIYLTMSEVDSQAVWLVQNWMFVSSPISWPINRVKAFLTAVPNGRMLVLDLQAEQWPQYNLYDMYYGQPFIWCMLHNFGGTLGMFGNVITINKDVYEARSKVNSTMIGTGLTPEGINQNYFVYDLMLESAWRKSPVADLEAWAGDYAERRYGCNSTTLAWKYLLKSVYSFNSLNMMRGKYVITRRPSFRLSPWAWYKSRDLFEAWNKLASSDGNCNSDGYYYDVVDVTRQALQYRAEQLYLNLQRDRLSTSWVFNASISQYLDVMNDLEGILQTNINFHASNWFDRASAFASTPSEAYTYQLNSRNQITMWGPNGEISDYACKQWIELFRYYYTPRWSTFLNAALDSKLKNERFDEKGTQNIVKAVVEQKFLTVNIPPNPYMNPINAKSMAVELYEKWANIPDLEDLPMRTVKVKPGMRTTMADVDFSNEDAADQPTVVMLASLGTTPLE